MSGQPPFSDVASSVPEVKTEEATDEAVEHVDSTGRVIEVVTRARMRAETLRHRCTYVFVLRSTDSVVVHKRANWKSIYPGFWDPAFGGVCGVGESWALSAERELFEEAGISGANLDPPGLTDLGPLRYEAEDGRVWGRVFLARSDAPLTCPDGEVVATAEIPVSEITSWLEGQSVSLDSKLAVPLLLAHLNKF